MHRIVVLSIVLALVVTAMGCSTTQRACTCSCHGQHATTATNHALTANRTPQPARYTPPATSVRSYATGSSYRPARTAVAPTVPYRTPLATTRSSYRSSTPRTYSTAGGYVRLRGSPVVHVRGCPKVRRSAPGGAVPCRANDGPACYTCRHAEAMRQAR